MRFVVVGLDETALLTTPLEVLEGRQAAGRLWVAVNARDLAVGFVTADALDDRAHLEELDVLPAHGRQGVGSALVSAVLRWAISRGFEEVSLSTYRQVPWNMPFYQRLGFRVLPRSRWSAGLLALREAEARAGMCVAERVLMTRWVKNSLA